LKTIFFCTKKTPEFVPPLPKVETKIGWWQTINNSFKKKSSQNPFFNLNNPNLSRNKQCLHPSLQKPTLRRNFKKKNNNNNNKEFLGRSTTTPFCRSHSFPIGEKKKNSHSYPNERFYICTIPPKLYKKESNLHFYNTLKKKLYQKVDSNLHLYNTLKLYQKKESSLQCTITSDRVPRISFIMCLIGSISRLGQMNKTKPIV
jgi:hypothetical protein